MSSNLSSDTSRSDSSKTKRPRVDDIVASSDDESETRDTDKKLNDGDVNDGDDNGADKGSSESEERDPKRQKTGSETEIDNAALSNHSISLGVASDEENDVELMSSPDAKASAAAVDISEEVDEDQGQTPSRRKRGRPPKKQAEAPKSSPGAGTPSRTKKKKPLEEVSDSEEEELEEGPRRGRPRKAKTPSKKSKEKEAEPEYIVECILFEGTFDKRRYYFVKWEHYSILECTWEPESHVENLQIMDDFDRVRDEIPELKVANKDAKTIHEYYDIRLNAEKILEDRQVSAPWNRREYHVKWQGHPILTWEPAKSVHANLLRAYKSGKKEREEEAVVEVDAAVESEEEEETRAQTRLRNRKGKQPATKEAKPSKAKERPSGLTRFEYNTNLYLTKGSQAVEAEPDLTNTVLQCEVIKYETESKLVTIKKKANGELMKISTDVALKCFPVELAKWLMNKIKPSARSKTKNGQSPTAESQSVSASQQEK